MPDVDVILPNEIDPLEPDEAAQAEFDAVIREIFGASPRAGAIVAAAQIEDMLKQAIIARLRPLDDEVVKSLFDGQAAPMSAFYGKIHVGHALKLYGTGVRDDLLHVKDIRNAFAHRMNVRSFNHQNITTICSKLVTPSFKAKIRKGGEESDPWMRFTETASHLYLGLAFLSLSKVQAKLRGTELGIFKYPGQKKPASSPRKVRARPTKKNPLPRDRNPPRRGAPQES